MNMNFPSAKSVHMAKKNLKLRQSLWSVPEEEVWNRKEAIGFTTIPRILPLILHLITMSAKSIGTGAGSPAKVYLDLWCRINDEGYVEVTDEEDFAYSAGYAGNRAKRTWQSHVKRLIDLGFVRGAKKSNREFGYLLVIDPYWVVEKLHDEDRVPEQWWNAFLARIHKTGALRPSEIKLRAEAKKTEEELKTKTKKKSVKPNKSKSTSKK